MMAKIALLLCLCAAIMLHVECGILHDLLHPTTSTTTTSTTSTTPRTPRLEITSNNLPQFDANCMVHFECKKKLKHAEPPKPCVKYCVKNIVCPDSTIKGKADQCFELSETHITQEYDEAKQDGKVHVMQVAMIDFPCQPGYLPDSRGRCREVW